MSNWQLVVLLGVLLCLNIYPLVLITYITVNIIIRKNEASGWIKELMDHSSDLDADPVINKHLIEIVGLICDETPKGLGLSKRFVLNVLQL